MHIIKKENKKNTFLTDHTLINNEIDRSMKLYKWDFILSHLPHGSFLVGGYIRDLILRRLTPNIDVDIIVPKNAIEIGKKIANDFKGKFIILDDLREVVAFPMNQQAEDLMLGAPNKASENHLKELGILIKKP